MMPRFLSNRAPLRKRAFAVYLETFSLKGVSFMWLRRGLKAARKTAWLMFHRIREVWADETAALFSGPAEVDATYVGGKGNPMPIANGKRLRGLGGPGHKSVSDPVGERARQAGPCQRH